MPLKQEMKETLEAYPLYDRVKLSIFEKYQDALLKYYEITCYKLKGYNPKGQDEFKAMVITLYIELRTKLLYPKLKKFNELKKLDGYINEPEKLDYEKAIYYFLLMRDLLERLGITKIELPKYPKEEVVGWGMEE